MTSRKLLACEAALDGQVCDGAVGRVDGHDVGESKSSGTLSGSSSSKPALVDVVGKEFDMFGLPDQQTHRRKFDRRVTLHAAPHGTQSMEKDSEDGSEHLWSRRDLYQMRQGMLKRRPSTGGRWGWEEQAAVPEQLLYMSYLALSSCAVSDKCSFVRSIISRSEVFSSPARQSSVHKPPGLGAEGGNITSENGIKDIITGITAVLHGDDECLSAMRISNGGRASECECDGIHTANPRAAVVITHSPTQAILVIVEQQRTGLEFHVVVPIDRHLSVEYQGDGRIVLHSHVWQGALILCFASVLAQWSATATLVGLSEQAPTTTAGPEWAWMAHYTALRPSSAQSTANSFWVHRKISSHVEQELQALLRQLQSGPAVDFGKSPLPTISIRSDDEEFKRELIAMTRTIMFSSDLNTLTGKQVRLELEDRFKRDLKPYKSFVDEHMMIILGQMEPASRIEDLLYLGTEWNAGNEDELRDNNVHAIVNVTDDIACAFEQKSGFIEYLRIPVEDEPSSDLLSHWSRTHSFICKHHSQGHGVLVHCKMGVSRSASTVMAFLMKQHHWSLKDAYSFVKERRAVVKPNSGFYEQLVVYEGIVSAHKRLLSMKRKTSYMDLNVPIHVLLHRINSVYTIYADAITSQYTTAAELKERGTPAQLKQLGIPRVVAEAIMDNL
eukprot:m.39531 g.39531  ORF g.39531 m.39531 type:complete len:669 (-) comp10318_c0_seq1:603-2609(-)